MSDVVRAAGGVIVRDGIAGPEILLVHRPQYRDWTFPKGKAEGNETDEQCALREVQEETGLVCELLDELEPTDYHDGRGRPKRVRWWRMRVTGGAIAFDDRGRRGRLVVTGRGRGATHLSARPPPARRDRRLSYAAARAAASSSAAPSRRPPRATVKRRSSSRPTSARMTRPATSVSARSGASPCIFTSLRFDRTESVATSASRSSASNCRPTSLPATRAVPPVVRARSGRGGVTPANAARADGAQLDELGGGRRIRADDLTCQPERADVVRTHPGRTQQRCAHDDLRRAPTDVDDADDLGELVRSRHRAFPRQPTLVVGAQDAHGPARRGRELPQQAIRAGALPARGGDDRLDESDTRLAGVPGEPACVRRGLVDLRRVQRTLASDGAAEPEKRARLVDRRDRRPVDVGDEQTPRVGADVDDPDPHQVMFPDAQDG